MRSTSVATWTSHAGAMSVYAVNPLDDRRWAEFVQRHPRASIFHTTGWLEALRRTYGYEPVAWTTCPPGTRLTNALLFCRVTSWLTARRLVAVPFADHCEPLVDRSEDQRTILRELHHVIADGACRFVEVRARRPSASEVRAARTTRCFHLHTLDLRPPLRDLYRSLHKDCIQRKIRRAEREGLTIERGRSEALLDQFYRLLVLTRRRHGLPPQPLDWFRNLVDCLGDKLTIHMASQAGRPIGGIVTLRHRDSLVYKYGASDPQFHRCGTMPFLFWAVIRRAKLAGIREIDFGRSDAEDTGLITFKDRLGAARSTVTHLRYGRPSRASVDDSAFARSAVALLARAPDRMFVMAGHILYRHIG